MGDSPDIRVSIWGIYAVLGKIIGVAVALLMGGGFWGVVLGLLIGHMFDKARSRKMAWFANQRERQALFFATTFEVMGHLTKSKVASRRLIFISPAS